MKSFKMNKMLGSIKRISTVGPSSDSASDPQGDGPEAIAARSVRAFCESGGGESTGDEVTFLPPIVESAESSPAAAAECARIIRKYLNRDYWSKPSYQYNSIMLMRILADNPGMTFTRNLDKKFIDTAKELLRTGRDPSVRQMMMETLDSFEAMKEYDEGLAPLIEMWRKEKEKAYKAYGGRPPAAGAGAPRTLNAPPFDPHSQNYFSRSHRGKTLPEPVELANRLEEARTSAKLLTQVVSCTPPSEVLSNELIREFADRCVSASRSIQGYMTSRDPAPDNDTMESLLDTNEQLQQALNLHQRSVLNARKHLGIGDRSENTSPAPPPGPPPSQQNNGGGGASTALPPPPLPSRAEKPSKGKSADLPPLPPVGGATSAAAAAAGPSRSTNGTPRPAEEEEDPFRDPQPESSRSSSKVRGHVGTGGGGGSSFAAGGGGPPELAEPKFAHEPFHPGFGSGEGIYQSSGHAKREAQSGGPDVSPVTTAAEGNSPERTRGARREEDSDLYDDGEGSYPGYEAGSKNKQPMYRY